MKRLVVMAVAAGAALTAAAMPTKKELQKAQEMVSDVTAADVKALKAKTKSPVEVAARHMELAGQVDSEAEKYLLLQGAFKLYAKAGDYDAAANVIEKLQTEIAGYDPEITVELCSAEFIRKMRENAPRLYALKENARRIVFYRKQLPIRESAVKKNPKDAQAQRKLAECHAELGDWSKALEVFVKAGGELKKMAEGETSGKVPAQELGDFWWDYETKSDTFVYKLHAAELYRKALADDSFKGLARTRAEQRAKEVEKDAEVMGACSSRTREVCQSRIAFKEGESFKIILDAKKKISVDFVACPPGEYVMSNEEQWRNTRHTVKITYPFFIMAWPATLQDADALVPKVGTHGREVYSPELAKLLTGDTPITDISPADIAAFADALSARMKDLPQFRNFRDYECRLPTEAEWCYVSRTNLNQSAKRGPSKGRDWFWSQRKQLGGLKYYEFPLWPIYVVREDFDLMAGNKWGVRYIWQNTMLADSYRDVLNGDANGRCYVQSVGSEIFGYSDEEINPIRICKDKITCSMAYDSGGLPRVFIRTGHLGRRDPIRFVFGPKISMLNVYPREENDEAQPTITKGSALSNCTFDLGCERKLEMIACPAGEFRMGEKMVTGDCNEVRKHQVKITRPFWLSKVAVTEAQWAKIMDEKIVGEKEDLRYDFPKGNTRLSAKRKFVEKLNRVFAAELPAGYVFRFPTEAELSYAMTSGGRDKVTELSIGVLGPSKADKEKIAKGMAAKGATLKNWPYMITQTKAGLAKPNKWGFYDIINNGEQLVLDRIAPNSKMRKLKCGEKNSIVNIEYESVETDPLCWEDDEKDAKNLCVDQANFWGRHMCGTWGWIETFRVCLGPDLVAEKKAKGK